ncbi:glycosyltransferase family 8 [Lecanosticta acicola]|uniref:glycogenin glucosyltransferase n=1 Tax=Lecanosticta acicola TaxID=111012 RepID=A0AAI9E9M8_9PEZI|nr:glycosyltransferase family 8 [Lecanosticta acicola]
MAGEEDVYCTLVMNDAYLPGAAVLAHSLRDGGSRRKLACLIVQDGLRDSTIQELRTLYNYVIPVERIGNPNPANLYLMNRPDLLYTFTKINLWRQTQFRKIVYIDSDVVALRAPEELFDIHDAFAAAPDVGWPDAFNTGVMVLSPHIGEYYALRGLATAGDSFDGADQGLLNQYFEHRPWKRLSFTYNTTPSANYQYEPAYRYFKRDISLVHFIGGEKPWKRGRTAQGTPGAFQEMLSRWWAVYDRHFSVSANDYIYGQRTPVAHYVTEGTSEPHHQLREKHSATGYPIQTTEPAPSPFESSIQKAESGQPHATPLMTERGEPAENLDQGFVVPAPTLEQRRFSAPHMEWDATRGAPPIESRPEAANFPRQIYEFNTDPAPFRPPRSYPQPPGDTWYGASEKPKAEDKPKPIFPWEERQDSRPTRRFVEDEPPPRVEHTPEPYADELEVSSDSRVSPMTPAVQINDRETWTAFASNKNAWDDDAGIDNYVRALTSFQKNRGQVQVLQENMPSTGESQLILSPTHESNPGELVEQIRKRRESLILTDFPSAVERPSLPVTPAPRRRMRTFWGEERDEEGELPAAAGVPDQADWDPNAQLEALRRNSLIGPDDLKVPGKKLSKRKMPSSAAAIPEHALSHPHVPITNCDGASNVPDAI